MASQFTHHKLLSGNSPEADEINIQPSELVILGETETGERFDVPNWIEHICGMLSVKEQDKRISYSDYLKPAHINGYPAIILSNSLANDDPESFAMVVQFVADNKLKARLGRASIRQELLPALHHERHKYIKG